MPLSRLFNWKKLRRTPEPPILRPVLASSSLTVNQSGSVSVIVTVNRTSYTGTITPSISGLPSGTTGAFSPTTLGSGTLTTTLTLTSTAGATTVSNQSFTVTCTGSGVNNATTTGTVTVAATVTPAISIAASKSSTTALQGATDTFDVTLTRTNYTGDVTLAVSGLPSGATASISPNPLTGGTLVGTVTVTNDVAATPVTNDAYTVGATGSGVSAATDVNMTHTITAPSSSRGIPNTSTAVKGTDFQSFADTAALQAQMATNESDSNKLKLFCGVENNYNKIAIATSSIDSRKAMRLTMDNTGGPPNQLFMYFAGYSGQPTANRAGSVNTAFTDCAVYMESSYAAGWTPVGSAAIGHGFKQFAMGYHNATARAGMEWNNTVCECTLGWGGATNQGDIGPAGYNTLTFNGDARPWSTSTVWAGGVIVCWYYEMRAIDADTVRYKFWTWLKGSDPTTNPQMTRDVNIRIGSLPTVNRLACCENFNQVPPNRYMPDGGYMDVHCAYAWDLGYDSNPLNF